MKKTMRRLSMKAPKAVLNHLKEDVKESKESIKEDKKLAKKLKKG